MRRHIWRILLTLAVLGVLAGWRASTAAQTASTQTTASRQNPDILAALLVEVRGLRTAMEQMASAGPRVQLALGRLQLQEQRVNTLLRRQDDVRTSVATAERELNELRREIQQLEALPGTDDKTPERQAIEQQIRHTRAGLVHREAELQRLQGEESSVTQQITLEQGRWSDINRSLEELERALARK